MEIIETIHCTGGHTLRTYHDECCESPREWDTLGTIYSNHNEYNPDRHTLDEILDDEGNLSITDTHYYVRVYAYIHGGIALSTTREWPFNDKWDSGLFGIIAVGKDTVAKTFPEWTEDDVAKALECEVRLLDDWYNGRCYGFVLTDRYGEEVDSCRGYIGHDAYRDMVSEAEFVAEAEARDEEETEYVTGKAVVSVEVAWKVSKAKAAEIGEEGIAAALETLVLAKDPTACRVNGVTVTESAAV
jgi:hypothetical protein